MENASDNFPQQKKLENLLPNFAGSPPPISPKTSPTSLWKSLVLIKVQLRSDKFGLQYVFCKVFCRTLWRTTQSAWLYCKYTIVRVLNLQRIVIRYPDDPWANAIFLVLQAFLFSKKGSRRSKHGGRTLSFLSLVVLFSPRKTSKSTKDFLSLPNA